MQKRRGEGCSTFIGLVFVLLSLACVALAEGDDPVIRELNDENFDEVTGSGMWLTHLYVGVDQLVSDECASYHPQHCEHCDEVEATMRELSRSSERPFFDLQLARLNCQEYEDPCLDLGVNKRYPLLGIDFFRLIRKGLPWKNGTTTEEVRQWISIIEGYIVRMDEQNFKDLIAEGDWMVQFTQPFSQCKLCRDAYPMWTVLARAAPMSNTFRVGWVFCDGVQNIDICNEYVTHGYYPKLTFFQKGEPIDYDGLQRTQSVLEWVHRKQNPPSPPPEPSVDTAANEIADAPVQKDEL